MNKIDFDGECRNEIVPLISVAMPVYNGGKYLAEAINSILAQTFSNFEFIIIDDGSTDDSVTILKGYQKRDYRIRLVTRENRGFSNTVNEIVDLARGTWIARMDQDDIAAPQRFERQLVWLEKTGADICGSWIKLFGTGDQRIIKHPKDDQAIKMKLLFGCSFAHPTVIMKTELVRALRYNPDWDKAEDYELWVRCACMGWKMTNIPEVLLLYRQHGTQISKASSVRQKELTQLIRRRYWAVSPNSSKLNSEWIDEVLNLIKPTHKKSNMDYVDFVLNYLLRNSLDETRAIILEYASILYLKAAADCPDVIARWIKLNKTYDIEPSFEMKIKLFILNIFNVNPNGRLFETLKTLYFSLKK